MKGLCCAANFLQNYGMAAVVALARPPQLDALFIRATIEALNFDSCPEGSKWEITDISGKRHKLSTTDLRHRVLAKTISQAVRVSSESNRDVAEHNRNVLRLYLSSFNRLETIAQNVEGIQREMPIHGSEISPKSMSILQEFLKEEVEAVAYSCKRCGCRCK